MIDGPTLAELLGPDRSVPHATLEDIEADVWPEAEFPTSLIRRAHAYRKISLCDMQIEHVRLLVGQAIGAEILIPLALDVLAKTPCISGDLFEGDLVCAMGRPQLDAYWSAHPDLKSRYLRAVDANIEADIISEIRQDLLDIKERLSA